MYSKERESHKIDTTDLGLLYMLANNINEVIQNLNNIISDAKDLRSRKGFFAAVYRQVTLKVKQGIENDFFDDAPRMEEFTTQFANRYLSAFNAYNQGEKLPRCWQHAFDVASQAEFIIAQHLILGINAHINLDLGIIAAQISPGDELPNLEGDFNKINTILAEILDPAQQIIDKFSPLMSIIDKVGGRSDEAIANFSIDKARQEAWENAQILAYQTTNQQEATLNKLDKKVFLLGRLIAEPGRILGKAIELIRWAESDDIPAIIDALNHIA